MSASQYQARQTEAAFQATVVEAATQLGWICVHFPAMLANPSGWPDLLLFRDGRLIIAELKTERGRLGPRQREWCDRLFGAGFPVRVWTPAMWDTEIVPALRGNAL